MNTSNQKKASIAVVGAKGLPSRVDGLEVYIDEICSRLSDRYDITVFCRKRYCDKIVKEYKNINVVHVPSINTKHLDAVSYGFFATMISLIKGYDVIWYNAMGSSVMEWIPKLFKKKILTTVHGLDWKRERFGKISSKMVKFGEKMIAKCSTKIIVLNEGDANYFKAKWNRQVSIIHNGVCIPPYENDGGKEKDFYLFASRIAPEKDLKTLINAFDELKTSRKLIIAGKGTHTSSYENEMRSLAEKNPNIVFVGYVIGEKLEELYRNAYVYILPSTIEGQSIGLLEAMSYGVPCIVSDIPENVSVIKNLGYCFNKGDKESLLNILKHCENSENELAEKGRLARQEVISIYGIESTVEATKNVIDELLED